MQLEVNKLELGIQVYPVFILFEINYFFSFYFLSFLFSFFLFSFFLFSFILFSLNIRKLDSSESMLVKCRRRSRNEISRGRRGRKRSGRTRRRGRVGGGGRVGRGKIRWTRMGRGEGRGERGRGGRGGGGGGVLELLVAPTYVFVSSLGKRIYLFSLFRSLSRS